MKKSKLNLIAGVVFLLAVPLVYAQTTPSSTVDEDTQSAAPAEGQSADSTGLTVEEVRIRDRLDRVVIQHGDDGLSEYYEFNDRDDIYQDGSLTERGVMRQWRIGGKP